MSDVAPAGRAWYGAEGEGQDMKEVASLSFFACRFRISHDGRLCSVSKRQRQPKQIYPGPSEAVALGRLGSCGSRAIRARPSR